MPRPVLPRSGVRDYLHPHESSLFELGRDRPTIPGALTDLPDVNDLGGILDGQSWTYDFASGSHLPQSHQQGFNMQGALGASSTAPLDLLCNGAIRRFRGRLGTVGSTDTVLALKLNGTTIGTLTILAGQPSAAIAIHASGTPIVPFVRVFAEIDVVIVQIVTAGDGAADLQGWVAL